jgi:hypothetical protein
LIIQYTRVHSFVNYWKPFSCVFHGSLIYLQAIHILWLSVTYWHSSFRSLPHKMKAINLSHDLGPLYVTRAQTCCNFLEFHTCTRQAFYATLKLLRSHQTMEFSANSTWLLVTSWLFCLQNFPCLVSFWCMRGGSVEVWAKNILYRFMKGQTHFGPPRVKGKKNTSNLVTMRTSGVYFVKTTFKLKYELRGIHNGNVVQILKESEVSHINVTLIHATQMFLI